MMSVRQAQSNVISNLYENILDTVYDVKSYSDDFLRKGSKAVGPEMN